MNVATTCLSLLAGFALVAPLPVRARAAATKAEKAQAKTAKALLDWAAWCAQNGAPEPGRSAQSEAVALGTPAGDELTAELDAADETATGDAVERGRKLHGTKIAKAYDALATVKHDAAERSRFAGYRLRALHWDPSKARGKKLARWIDGQEDVGFAARLIGGAWAAAGDGDASAAITSLVATKATGSLLLIGSADHPLVAFVSLPKGWRKGRSYPVLVGVDGAGSGFEGYGRKSTSSRGARDVIGVYPMTLSNTNGLVAKKYPHYSQTLLDENKAIPPRLVFDLAGVNAVLALLTQHMGAEERVFLTGFSGGGMFTYMKLLQEPSRVAGAVPACGNFGGGGVQGAPGAGADGGPPVLLLTGENDPHRYFTRGDKNSPGIDPQTENAEKALAKLGYTHVERRMLKSGHSPLHTEVWKFVDSVLDTR